MSELQSHVDDENVILSSTDKGEKYLCFLPESPKTEKVNVSVW